MAWISIGKVAALFGVTTQAIRLWTYEGKLSARRTLGGHRRYNLEEIEKILGIESKNKKTVLYSRVSAHDQKEDLLRQKKELRDYIEKQEHCNVVEISEIGSVLNYAKRGLKKLLNLILSGGVRRIVVSYKDRLMRFATQILEQVCAAKNVEIVILNERPQKKFEEAVVEDVLCVLTVYCAKIYGRRSHERRKKRQNKKWSGTGISHSDRRKESSRKTT
ncbi:resolvase [Candidatus Uabimicrobium amorphum]|uniref:Resolvase n=1 Tax=Uabimicrobium amorphum TaxID=2596890 RepID=A0A5S9II17_UABAM|nr:IS607 family transposase [Candidatus Uabimicrobium amorphum]BBM82199.1 resolvase [Candidatus Uabimicrobium amorphum]